MSEIPTELARAIELLKAALEDLNDLAGRAREGAAAPRATPARQLERYGRSLTPATAGASACGACGEPVTEHTFPDGTTWTVGQLQSRCDRYKLGRLCFWCYSKQSAQARQAEAGERSV